MAVVIRRAHTDDFKDIVQTHIQCFPNSFSTSLGRYSDLLEKYYLEFYSISPELFLVAVDEQNEISGFCMGYYYEDKGVAATNFKKNNRMSILLCTIKLLLCFDKATWKKISSLVKKKGESEEYNVIQNMTDEEMGDLLSICVKERLRGTGTADKLIHSFEKVLSENGRKYCRLSVKKDNARGIHFYEKNGYIPYKNDKQDEIVLIKLF